MGGGRLLVLVLAAAAGSGLLVWGDGRFAFWPASGVAHIAAGAVATFVAGGAMLQASRAPRPWFDWRVGLFMVPLFAVLSLSLAAAAVMLTGSQEGATGYRLAGYTAALWGGLAPLAMFRGRVSLMPAPVWFVLVGLAVTGFVLDLYVMLWALTLVGAQLVWAGRNQTLPPWLRLQWLLFGVATIAWGAEVWPWRAWPTTALVHLGLMGPLLCSWFVTQKVRPVWGWGLTIGAALFATGTFLLDPDLDLKGQVVFHAARLLGGAGWTLCLLAAAFSKKKRRR